MMKCQTVPVAGVLPIDISRDQVFVNDGGEEGEVNQSV
jgi:hypothetical protein